MLVVALNNLDLNTNNYDVARKPDNGHGQHAELED